MEMLPGDLFDKCTILRIKHDKGLDVPEYPVVLAEVKKMTGDDKMLDLLYEQLWSSNLIQYDWEDRIRVEKKMSEVGKIAILIREQNDNRVNLKNNINKIFKAFQEVKLYKRSS
jgi:hypothetical protein